MSQWTHTMCDDCWDERHPKQKSGRPDWGSLEACCWCGLPTRSGIYVREDPETLPNCRGHANA